MIRIIDGDVLQATEDVIAHQVNSQGVMGSGVALQIKNKFPSIYEQYAFDCKNTKNKETLMGKCFIYNSGNISIANLFGQFSFGTHKVQTSYVALRKAFEQLDGQLAMMELKKKKSVAIPYKIGCGLGGGDWSIVYNIIEETIGHRDVVIYKYEV